MSHVRVRERICAILWVFVLFLVCMCVCVRVRVCVCVCDPFWAGDGHYGRRN